ncbi:hypothetical protein [Paraburkholderia youngii]|uniref:hypothetical protein n=1 Tax=Paraburkholderia youngii TaxID=2782701 RepID=UPI003D24346B
MKNEDLKMASTLATMLLFCAPGIGLLIAMRQIASDHLLPPWFDFIGMPTIILGAIFLVSVARKRGETLQALIGAALSPFCR